MKTRQNHHEDEVVEFKKAENNFDFDDLGKYFSALSNEANLRDKDFAWLVFGVENKTREAIGTTYKNSMTSLQKLKHDLAQHTTDRNTFRDIFELKVDGKRVLMFQVPAAPRGIPMGWQGHFYARQGESLVALDMSKYEEIRRQTAVEDWSKKIVDGATMDDLDPEAIKKAREKFAKKHPELVKEMKKWDDVAFLNKAKITLRGKITNTAILLVGRTESEYLISPAVARIRWIYKDSTGTERDFAIETCPFVVATDTIYNKIRNFKYLMINPELSTMVPDSLETYDPFIIREALNNAIAHQDYGCQGMINIVEEEDRLIFTNMGRFIPDSVRSVLVNDAPEEHYRNKMLANAMVELGMVDTIGSGIKRMFDKQRERLFPMPDYDFRDNRVKVTIVGKVLDVDYAMLLSRDKTLSLLDIEMLSRIQMHRPLNNDEIAYLRKRKLVEGRKNALYFAKSMAGATGQKAEYTRIKGFDDEYYKDLILKALEQHRKLSRPEVNALLMNKLPEALTEKQKLSKIGNLLTYLRKNGKIELLENKMWARKFS
jgi:ATP-dependent DNA helicase RecG